ncbi:hypothetical protein KJ742_00960 [Patescibacteria group bacterium]|nr:hypothetical protein [Patescibacteria group bacterium]MBU1682493.1 hypothetical protein [Patescibacteria group bacterium]MBU1935279.1 hypothetical protein [Patescibacteria group bacterium]
MHTTLSKLFREIEAELGTHEFCIMALEALKSALLQYKIKDREELQHQLLLIFKLLKITKPRYAILLDSFYKILDECETSKTDIPIEELIMRIDRIIVAYQLEKLQLVQASEGIDFDDKSILIHDHSHFIHSVLASMNQKGKRFTVIVAEQNMEKTEDNIEFLHSHDIEYKVVPAHMLSHIEETVDMVFCGAVTFQENMNFVMDPGSKAIISHFHYEKKPIYVFITTSKFTLWPLTEESHEVYAKPDIGYHHVLTDIEYERIKFSHDRVSVDLIDYIVTEQGIFKPKELKEIFRDMFKKRAKKRERYFGEEN